MCEKDQHLQDFELFLDMCWTSASAENVPACVFGWMSEMSDTLQLWQGTSDEDQTRDVQS